MYLHISGSTVAVSVLFVAESTQTAVIVEMS